MNIAFFGSPEIARDILEEIHTTYPVSLVVSQPDKPVGRKHALTPTPVSTYAKQKNISLLTPDSPDKLDLSEIDIVLLVAYGEIIPKNLLDQPKHGFINVHYSLLPNYRGASPVQTAILNGDEMTGVTIMQMDEELDHGEIITQAQVPIDIQDTTESLLKKLTSTSIPLLKNILSYIKEHEKLPGSIPQNHQHATYCERIEKQDAFVEYEEIKQAINNEQSAFILHNKIRAYYPWPNVWTILPDGKRCKIISSKLSHTVIPAQGGISTKGSPTRSALEDDKLTITEIQIEGKQKTEDTKLIHQLFT